MPNPKMPRHNSKEFNPDKGLPLIGHRDQPKIGQGAAQKATWENQMYQDGQEVEVVVNESLQKRHLRKK